MLWFKLHICVLTKLGILIEVFKPQVLGTYSCFTAKARLNLLHACKIKKTLWALKSFETTNSVSSLSMYFTGHDALL